MIAARCSGAGVSTIVSATVFPIMVGSPLVEFRNSITSDSIGTEPNGLEAQVGSPAPPQVAAL